MSNHIIEWSQNFVASAYLTSNPSFSFTLQGHMPCQPDAMIIRQITASMHVGGNITMSGTIGAVLYSDVTNQTIGSLVFPYNCSGVANANNSIPFTTNPQTHISLHKPINNSIFFQLQTIPIGSANPLPTNNFFISIQFDLVKYRK